MVRQLKDYPNIALNTEDLDAKIGFVPIFGRTGPIHVEIGSGKGTFLVHQAKTQSDVDFLGIEWARRYYRHAVDRIGRWGLTNVRLVRADAVTFLRDFVHEASVDCFHIYFPDPWPKKRHHKRRLLQESTMDLLVRCLKCGGEIRMATDHADYFEQMQRVSLGYAGRLERIEFARPAGAEEGELTGTNYERKYIRANRPIYTLALRKLA